MGPMVSDVPASAAGSLPTYLPGQRPLDQLDRRIVACLQINGRATWQQVASVVGASESTVSRRANRLLRDGVIRVSAMLDPGRCGLGTPLLMQVKCAAGATNAVASTLADRPDVRFLASVAGSFDLVLEVVVGSRAYLADVLLGELGVIPGITATTTETIVRHFKTAYDWSRALLPNDPGALEPDPVGCLEPVTLDMKDMQMAQVLRDDGRASVADLAARLDVSESSVRRRLERLTSSGALWFGTFVDPQTMGFETEMFVWMEVDLAHLEEIAGTLTKRPEVRYLSITTGYSDLACELVLRDLDDLYRFSTQVLGSLSGVRRTEMGQELQILKRGYLAAPMRSRQPQQ